MSKNICLSKTWNNCFILSMYLLVTFGTFRECEVHFKCSTLKKIHFVNFNLRWGWGRGRDRPVLLRRTFFEDVSRCRFGQTFEKIPLAAAVEVVAGLLLLVGHAHAVVLVRLAGGWTGLLRLLGRWLVHAVLKLTRPKIKNTLKLIYCISFSV